ncbi:hypothetical protein ATKI12_5448 [Kitasatospora sp. Ki12]
MDTLLAELGKKLADRWLTLLVLPGALYLAVVAASQRLGHTHPFRITGLTGWVRHLATSPAFNAPASLTLVLLAALLASSTAGLAAQAGGSLIERLCLASHWQAWPTPLRQLAGRQVEKRLTRWQAAKLAYDERVDAERRARATRISGGTERSDRIAAQLKMTRIAEERPVHPTWIGDRFNAASVRFDREYNLDLGTVWPHLRLTVPETTRSEVAAAQEALSRSTTLVAWGALYVAPAALWWPGLLIAAAIAAAGWRRTQTATDVYTTLLEAATRLYAADLARQIGITHAGPLNRQTGWALTCLLQDQPHLIELTAGHTQVSPPQPDAPPRTTRLSLRLGRWLRGLPARRKEMLFIVSRSAACSGAGRPSAHRVLSSPE